jgi:phosphohistidine phosphatase
VITAGSKLVAVKCYFLRHGLAVDAAEWSGSDFDRPLAPEGKKRMERAAKTLAALDVEIDVIITSPRLRAKQTAAIVAQRLKAENRVVEDARLAGDFGPRALAAILSEHPGANEVMLVGHEPDMSRTAGAVIGGASLDFKPGSIACVSLPNPAAMSGELAWFVPPKILALGRK